MEEPVGQSDLLKLKQTQKSILEGLDAKISQLEQYVSDYKAIDELLTDLPKRLSHSGTMIPFSGKKAMVPAVLEHTNEVMVYLGSDLFASVSAHHCQGVVGRRLDALATQVKASREERRLIADRLSFTDDLFRERSSQSDGESMVEIREEISEEEEARWLERHRRLVAEERRQLTAAGPRTEDKRSESELLRRLEELELLEAADEQNQSQLKPILRREPKSADKSKTLKRRVSFHGVDQPSKAAPIEEEDEEEAEESPSIFIRFRHTPNIPSHSSSDITPASLVAHCSKKSSEDATAVSAIQDVVVERPTSSGDVMAASVIPNVVENPTSSDSISDTSKISEETSRRPKSKFRSRRDKRD